MIWGAGEGVLGASAPGDLLLFASEFQSHLLRWVEGGKKPGVGTTMGSDVGEFPLVSLKYVNNRHGMLFRF